MKAILLALALTACTVPAQAPAVTPTPSPVTVTPDPAPVIPAPTGPLLVLDSSGVTVTLENKVLKIELTSAPVWMRIKLPDDSISPITVSPYCGCLDMHAGGLTILKVDFLKGLTVETSTSTSGPWTVAAKTQ
jgi:hypothetical protein